jgi:hypothetical protein
MPVVSWRSIGLRPAAGGSPQNTPFRSGTCRTASPDDAEQFLELGERSVGHGASCPRDCHARRADEVLLRMPVSGLLAGLGLHRESHDDVPSRSVDGQRCGILNTFLYEESRERSVEVSVKKHVTKSALGGLVQTGVLSSNGESL